MANIIIPAQHKADYRPSNFKHEKVNPLGLILPRQPWENEQEALAKDALAVLTKHYFGYKWGIEFTSTSVGSGMGMMVIRLLDIPTEVVYTIKYEDINRDGMKEVMRGGGLFLEALGLKAKSANGDDFRDLKQTPRGHVVANPDAMPDNNPGREATKKQFETFIQPK